MNKAFFSKNFNFVKINTGKYRHTDQSNGSPYNYLAYLEKGECKIVSANKTIEVKSGEVFYIPIGLSYHSYWYDAEFLSFGFKSLNTDECTGMELQVIRCDENTLKKVTGIPAKMPVTSKALSLFYDAIASAIPFMERTPLTRDEQTVEKAQKYISEHPESSIPEVAKACTVGESHLYFLFKKITGSTPNDFRQKVLCDKGIELLTTTNKTIEEISDNLNMSSGSYFRKVLKKNTGLTPREIRKNSLF